MVHSKNRPSRKVTMLQSAVELIASKGIDALTIDALAESTSATKGGVQYHFPSKDNLFIETLEYLLNTYDQAVSLHAAKLKGPCRWLRAYVELSTAKISAEDRVAGAMLAILTSDDPRAEPFRRFKSKWRIQAVEDGIDPAVALVVRLAADSLWTERVFGGATPKESKMVREQLLKWIDEASQ
jgi:AcrR family transcriptional regulator